MRKFWKGDVLRVLDPAEIPRFVAADKYSTCRHAGREWVIDDSLAALEARLAPLGFVRVHRAELVQLARIVALHQVQGTLEAELDDGQRASVSRAARTGTQAPARTRIGLARARGSWIRRRLRGTTATRTCWAPSPPIGDNPCTG
jgi:two-component system LytT family response regulator